MDNDKIMLLAQLIDSMKESARQLEAAYNANDKKKFDAGKQAIFDFQTKINFLIKQK
jgi:phage portal protein BeeE